MNVHPFRHDGDRPDYYDRRWCRCGLPETNWRHPLEGVLRFSSNYAADVLAGKAGDPNYIALTDAVVSSLGDLAVEPSARFGQGRFRFVVGLRRRFKIRRHRNIMRPTSVAR